MTPRHSSLPESSYAWWRLLAAVLISTIGGVGMWSSVVALPSVQAEFDAARGDAALPYTFTMIGIAVGSVVMGRVADRFGVVVPVVGAAFALGAGYVAAAFATDLWQFAIVHGLLIALFGSAATFAPLIADTSHWFVRRRGIAVAICASGSYLAGAFWPPVIQAVIDVVGWRHAHMGIGIFCAVTILPLALALRRPPPVLAASTELADGDRPRGTPDLPPAVLQALLVVAGVACCVAMSMPQVHIVAYCVDLGYGAARGAEMLSLMLGFGIVSRLASGWIADRIGGLPTLLLGSVLQATALILYLPFDGLYALYMVAALFGLFQGGIVPSYAIVIREYFPASEAGARVGLVLTATVVGMAFGGWMTGAIFDVTGSYRTAFLNGIAWNVLNMAIAAWLLFRTLRPRASMAH